MTVSCEDLDGNDINEIMNRILMEFPLSEIEIRIPKWLDRLDSEHELIKSIYNLIGDSVADACKIRDTKNICSILSVPDYVKKADSERIDLGSEVVEINLELTEEMFYKVLSECAGMNITDDEILLKLLTELSSVKKEYDHIKSALDSVRETGYGIVSPESDEMILEEPKIIKQGGRYGVKLKACAPSIHMMRADIETEVSPIVGTVKQSQELIENLLSEYKDDPMEIMAYAIEENLYGTQNNLAQEIYGELIKQ